MFVLEIIALAPQCSVLVYKVVEWAMRLRRLGERLVRFII